MKPSILVMSCSYCGKITQCLCTADLTLIADLETLLSELFLCELLHHSSLLLLRFLNILVLLLENHLNMARTGLIWVDATMGTVSTATTMLGTLHLDVSDGQVVCIEVLEVSVGLCILEEVKHNLTRLDGPTTLGHLELLCLRRAANAPSVLAERDASLPLTN